MYDVCEVVRVCMCVYVCACVCMCVVPRHFNLCVLFIGAELPLHHLSCAVRELRSQHLCKNRQNERLSVMFGVMCVCVVVWCVCVCMCTHLGVEGVLAEEVVLCAVLVVHLDADLQRLRTISAHTPTYNTHKHTQHTPT